MTMETQKKIAFAITGVIVAATAVMVLSVNAEAGNYGSTATNPIFVAEGILKIGNSFGQVLLGH